MNNNILALGTTYLDITCINFPFNKGLFQNRETVGSEYICELGGSALNFAKIASQLQLATTFIGKVGDDPTGKTVNSLLEQTTIDPHIITGNDSQTNLAIHYVHASGSSIMTSCGNANQSLSFEEIGPILHKVAGSVGYVYLGGIFKLKKLLPHITKLATKLKQEKIKIVLDHGRVNNSVSAEDLGYLRDFFPYVDIYLPSLDEFLQVWDSKNVEEGIEKLRKSTQAITIIKKADEGAIGSFNDAIYEVSPYNVKVINTVGAGDSFNAGFLQAYSDSKSIQDSIRYACAVAAIKISTTGDLSMQKVHDLMNHEE